MAVLLVLDGGELEVGTDFGAEADVEVEASSSESSGWKS